MDQLFKKIIPLCLGILLSAVTLVPAQDKEVKKLVMAGQNAYEADNIEDALQAFLGADKLKPGDPHVTYMTGVCYHKLDQPLKALPFLESSYKAGNQTAGLFFYLGISYHRGHKFAEAIQMLEKFLNDFRNTPEEMEEEAKVTLNYSRNGLELMKNPVKVKIKNLGPGVNSEYPEYVPAISADETVLLFTSRRNNSTGGQIGPDGMYFEDIYMSVRKDTVWSKAEKLGTAINTPSHDGCVGISPDGQEMFLYKVPKGMHYGDLYVSELQGDSWSAPKNMGSGINSRAWEPSGSISPDERTFFFTSNRDGGYGGTDIYMSRKLPSGEWGPAMRLGPEINTPYDDNAPFIQADGKTLYFSSKGHTSMGGYDIFTCVVDPETGKILELPKNVGYPINTAEDDIFFVWSADNKRAYFSSERDRGYGEKDLYVLEREEARAALVMLKGTVRSCDGHKPVGATIAVTDHSGGQQIGVYNSNSSSGKYTVILPAGKNYGIAVESPGYLFYSKNIDIPLLKDYVEINDSVCLEKIKIGTHIVLRNVFFDVDKATLRPESESELERLAEILQKNPTIKIQIDGHTDSDGNDDHNLKLSDARAHAVVEYLVSKKGISQERLGWKGYGETQPIAPNDTPANKQLNRRTEFSIVGQ